MKGSRIYIICIVAFLVFMFVVEYNMPKKFVWNPTFSKYDKQPFGCYVFDDILDNSLPDGYSVSGNTLYQLYQDSIENTGVLLIMQDFYLIDAEKEAILNMATKGNKLLLVSSYFDRKLRDTLSFDQAYDYFSVRSLKKYASSESSKRDSIVWQKDDLYDAHIYTSYPHLSRSYFTRADSTFKILARKDYNETLYSYDAGNDTTMEADKYQPPVVISKKIGKGEIILASCPLLFTNYGILDGENADFIFRTLTQMKGMPIIRIDAYTGITEEPQSPLRYILSQRPLQWAIYMVMILIILFMIFTARRRQRIIPVVKGPQNKSIEFAELVGTLYYQRKNHADLIHKKYIYFAEILRRTIQVDIEDESDVTALFHRISQKTGLEEDIIKNLIIEIRLIVHGSVYLSEERMKDIIDRINNVLKHLN